MCPLCVANMALVAAGATSSGGLAALALSKFHRRNETNQVRGTKNEKQTKSEELKMKLQEMESNTKTKHCLTGARAI